MTLSKMGRMLTAMVATAALGLGMTACGGGTIGYMWVVGTFYNQISGFKIDDYTGNLTVIDHSPFSTSGVNPITIIVKPGGRFVYVVNGGTTATPPAISPSGTPTLASQATPGNITEFSVGGGGVLTYIQTFSSQGIQPLWATFDTTGNYMYVLDKYAPDTTGNGSITAFAVASDTGRLSLVPNASIKNSNQMPTSYFEVGANPIVSKIGSGGCLFTVSANSIFPYIENATNGQLTLATTGPYQVPGAVSLNSINTSEGTSKSAFIFLTDSTENMIYTLTAASGCALSTVAGGQQTNLTGATNPVNTLTSTNGNYLYVINQSQTGTTSPASSSISAYSINAQGVIAQLANSANTNPYATGSGPVCIVQDPSNQYIYTSDNNDSTITGHVLDQNDGTLSPLTKNSVFPTTMKPQCLAVSGDL